MNVVALALVGVAAVSATATGPIEKASASVASATVASPVELAGRQTLMDIVGQLTGLGYIIPMLDSPNNPLYPEVLILEALGELLVVIPTTLVIGVPLTLLTEGPSGFDDLHLSVDAAANALSHLFNEIGDWYQTRNWLTGELLHPGSGVAELPGLVNVDGFEDIVSAASNVLDHVFAPLIDIDPVH